MADRGGLVWKLQLAVFVVVALDSGRRVLDGVALDTLGGLANLALLAFALVGAVYVAWTRQPVSAAFGGDRGDAGDDAAADEADPAPEES